MKPPIPNVDAVFGTKLNYIDGRVIHGEETVFFYSPLCRTAMTMNQRVKCSYIHHSPMYAFG